MNDTTNTGNGQSKLIFDESPLTFSRTIAHAIGLPKAIILQQIYYLTQQPNSGKILDDGHRYVWNSYDEWKRDFFPFWTTRTLIKHFIELEKTGLLVSTQPNKSNWNVKKYYRIDHERLSELTADFIGYEKTSQPTNKIGYEKTSQPIVKELHNRLGKNFTTDCEEISQSSIQRSLTKKTDKEDDANIFLASDDAEKIIEGEIDIPETSLMVVSGAIPAADKSLHQQLMALIEKNIGKLTSSSGGKEAKGSKLIREYIDKNPDTTLQDVQDCLTWIEKNKRMAQLSLTSVASQLPTYMAIKRKNGKVPGTQFLSVKEKSAERLTDLNNNLEEFTEGAQDFYEQLKSLKEKPITEIERLVPGTQFKTSQEKSLEKLNNRDYNEINRGASEMYEQLAAKIGTKRKV